jgi:putative nucleotidyltransferase with HDIG domain
MNQPAPATGSITENLESVRAALPANTPIYLVGGAVRDLLLGRITHDLDFVLPQRAIAAARRTANALGGAFFALDTERDTGRAILNLPNGGRLVLDFASFRGPDLESDLRDRDFTVNAIAIRLDDLTHLVDPLNGAADLRQGLLRACAPTAFQHDPLRILRLARQAVSLGFKVPPETMHLARQALPGLANISPERTRDEIFRILDSPQPVTALRMLDRLGALAVVLPELEALKGVQQSPPHIDEAWAHTLGVVQKLGVLLDLLKLEHNPEAAANWTMGLVALRLGRYRQQLSEHLSAALNPDRSLRALLLLAALYHDTGKPGARQVEAGGQVRFFGHDALGAELARQRGEAMRLSNTEVDRMVCVVKNHMRPLLLAQAGTAPGRRAAYRFFRDTGPAGVDVCLLSLADTLATYGPGMPQAIWIRQLDTVRSLLEAWWEQTEQVVAPPPLLDGYTLMHSLGLKPGPQVGRLLEAIREAQAAGEIQTADQALALARAEVEKGAGLEAPDG